MSTKAGFKLSNWQPANQWCGPHMSSGLRDWILFPASMTKRVKSRCPDVRINVLSHAWGVPSSQEAKQLNMPPRRTGIVREIIMTSGETPLLYGRTIIPTATVNKAGRRLRHLGAFPIGYVLFQNRSVERSPFDLSLSTPGDYEYQSAISQYSGKPESLWARRSHFYLSKQPLLLTEVFYPEMWKALGLCD